MGEGWLLTAEMCDLVRQARQTSSVLSRFTCPTTFGKAVINACQMHPESNIVAVDTIRRVRVNQLNRIRDDFGG